LESIEKKNGFGNPEKPSFAEPIKLGSATRKNRLPNPRFGWIEWNVLMLM